MKHILSNENEARTYIEAWGDQKARQRLDVFARLLLDENQKQNLISKSSEQTLWLRHLADSAQLLEFVSRETQGQPWLDLGSGPGLPGLVIAILRPEVECVLVESRGRRVEFLELCVAELGLDNCRVEGCRLEQVLPFQAGVISARAFAPLEKLLRLSAPFSTKATRYVLPKGRSAAHELDEMNSPIRNMFHVEQSLTDPEAGIIVNV